MEIKTYPDPILLTPCKPVTSFHQAKKVANELYEVIDKITWGDPVGMAANQIGHNLAIFVAKGEIYVNPELKMDVIYGKKVCREGCYSLEPGKYDYKVTRNSRIFLKWQDLDGKWHEKSFSGFEAQVIQHEYDHLQGRLCINR